MITKLKDFLIVELNDAKEVWVAVALMNEFGLQFIENSIPKYCRRNYLVGINLPTPPMVLREMQRLMTTSDLVSARIYYGQESFHPKVFIVQKQSGVRMVILGSSNATQGGFDNNIEMNYAVADNSECSNLVQWFQNLFDRSQSISDVFLNAYEITYKKNKFAQAEIKSNIDHLLDSNKLTQQHQPVEEGQFFRQTDFDAFHPTTHYNKKPPTVAAREKVRQRLLELNQIIFHRFTEFGIDDLHLPRLAQQHTSQWFHSRGHNHRPKEAIWLHYGKSPADLAQIGNRTHRSFTQHSRMQVILRHSANQKYIGIWLYIGKVDGSPQDRLHIRSNLAKNRNYAERFFEYISDLGDAYWIKLNEQYFSNANVNNSTDLKNILQSDNLRSELIIGRNYHPNDTAISNENIAETLLIEFSKLFKIYLLARTDDGSDA